MAIRSQWCRSLAEQVKLEIVEIINAPSLLASDHACFGEGAKRAGGAGADWLHLDITDEAVFSGSIIRRGEIGALVYATGGNTYFGKTAQLVQEALTVSHFQKVVLKIGNYLKRGINSASRIVVTAGNTPWPIPHFWKLESLGINRQRKSGRFWKTWPHRPD
jgi:magnesium-transporting ATPase (P-type)